MNKKAAILMMEGYEESETIQIVDLLRRAGVQADTFCFQDNLYVLSMQGMKIKADHHFSDEVKNYDILIIPGGRNSWQRLIDQTEVMETIQWFNDNQKLIGAMCSGTKVLQAAQVLKGKKCTGYTGYEKVLTDGIFVNDAAVYNQNIVTSQGPATPYPFAFKIMEALEIDPEPYKEKLLYHFAGGK